jgi:hypothetical protein
LQLLHFFGVAKAQNSPISASSPFVGPAFPGRNRIISIHICLVREAIAEATASLTTENSFITLRYP